MAVLEHLEPKRLFHFFEQLCAIPHGSRNTQAVSDWLTSFAKERNLEVHQDAIGNVIIIKEAAPGYEQAEPVIFQCHMDMVCEKAPGCTKDMEKEGLDLAIDGDKIYARETTLGGDNGIAVAMALAILDDPDAQHPRFEAVFTVDEEIGMLGAVDIDVAPLKAHKMINADSEEEGVFIVSCAGGNVTECILPVKREAYDGTVLSVIIDGLKGGHSGIEIDRGRANANMLMGRLLYAMGRKTDLRVISVDGGLKDNAITTSAAALIAVADAKAAQAVCEEMQCVFANEYRSTDPNITVSGREAATDLTPMDAEGTQETIGMLTCLPNGIQEMSHEIEGLVQTSLNLGILKTEDEKVTASFCVRSSVDSQKQMLVDRLESLMTCLGGEIHVYGDYSGWEFQKDSALRDLMVDTFKKQYGHEPEIQAVHAGVECGMFAGKIPGLDCVAIGPDLFEIHTYNEHTSAASVQRTWNLIVEILRRMK